MTRTVALVGAVHPAARGLSLALEEDPGVERVLGLSEDEPPLLGPKLEFVPAKPGDERFTEALAEAQVVVVFPLLNLLDRDEDGGRASALLDGLDHALQAAQRATRVVLWSSGVVYGAHADNPVPLTEEHPLRPDPGFAAAGLLAQAEQAVLQAAAARPGLTAVVLRGAGVWAPSWGTFLSRLLRAPALPGVRGFAPPVQALHPDDAVGALALAVRDGLEGVYNVAPDDWLPANEAARAAGRRRVELPEPVAASAAERLARTGLPVVSGELAYHMHPWVLANARLRAAGWTPLRSTAEALAEAGRERAGGPADGREPLLRRSDVAMGAAAGLAALGVLVAARRRARRT